MKCASVLCAAFLVVAVSVSAQQLPTVELTVQQPSQFLATADVTVSWQMDGGNANPLTDFISVWWDPFKATYTEYQNVSSNSGSAVFTLLNARFPYSFRFYRNSQLVAESEKVYPEGSYPMQIHAMFVPQHESRIQIIWTTNRTTGTETVFYGTSSSSLTNSVTAQTSTTYTQQQIINKVGLPPTSIVSQPFPDLGCRCLRCIYGTCYNDTTAASLYVDPGQFHVAEISGLASNTQYYFVVGEASGYQSSVHSFTSRTAASSSSSIQVLYVADAGVGYAYGPYGGSASHNSIPLKYGDAEGGRHVFDAIRRDPQHANDQVSIMNGDISYARGWPWIWELFHRETEQIFTQAPVMTVFGNHEFDYGNNPFSLCANGDSGGEAGIPTAVRFNFASESQSWFHMAHGPVHFIGLSSEESVASQEAWLRQVLPTVDRTVTPWLIVFQHRPIHMSSTWIDKDLSTLMMDSYSDLFSRYGVDMVLTGHSHYYERTCAINSGECAGYDYRPDWHRYENTDMAPNSCTKVDDKHWKVSLNSCKVTCMWTEGCNGCYVTSEGQCYLVHCAHPLPTQPGSNTIYSLERKTGHPPIYVVDGTAGGSHTPTSSPTSPITKYKDFSKWGYSRLKANATSLTWEHWHIDGSIVDSVTLTPDNVGKP